LSSATTKASNLRRARLDDLPATARIHRAAFFGAMPHMPVLHTPDEDLDFHSKIVFPHNEMWVAEHADAVVGFIAFRPDWVELLYIHPQHQGCGFGRSLLAVAQASNDSLRLWTFQANLRARRFYEKHGFRIERETDGAGNEERQPDILYFWTR
jgi:putative acetyltransferase